MILKLELDEARAELLTTFISSYIELTSTEEELLRRDLRKELPSEEVRKLEKLMTWWEKKGREEGRASN